MRLIEHQTGLSPAAAKSRAPWCGRTASRDKTGKPGVDATAFLITKVPPPRDFAQRPPAAETGTPLRIEPAGADARAFGGNVLHDLLGIVSTRARCYRTLDQQGKRGSMATLRAGDKRFEFDLVVFDKDGTLVDFDRLWAFKMRRAIEVLVKETGLDASSTARLLRLIGVDPETLKVVPESPLAVTTLPKIGVVATVGLHQAGFAWHAAEAVVHRVFMPAIEASPAPEDLEPIGPVRPLMQAIAAQGARIAILTSDDRRATEESLPLLGIDALVDAMVCGDDPLPSKPAPDGLLKLARDLQVPPGRVLMIGDSAADMRTGRNAGVAGCIAVLSGTGRREDLAALADVVITDISDIGIA